MSLSKRASTPTIKRLPSYLQVIEAAQKDGRTYISGTSIAEELELEPIQVRKDLAVTGIVGRPRIGFSVEKLIHAITAFLAWDRSHRAIIVGAGNLGSALMGYAELRRHGMNVIAAFDSDENKQGHSIHGIPVHSLQHLPATVGELGVSIAILTVPPEQAQQVAETLVESGIKSIWNFTNIKIKALGEVIVQQEDLSSGYAVLSVKLLNSFHNKATSANND